MLKVFIQPIDELINLDKQINIFKLEQPVLFREIFFNLEKNLTFSQDNKLIDFSKILIIDNCLNLNINDKKNLQNLYKFLESSSSIEQLNKFQEIKSNLLILFKELVDTSPFDLDYDIDMSLSKILSSFHISFIEENKSNYLEYFLNYIRTLHELTNFKILITYNLSTLLTDDEFKKIKYELKLYEIEILDFVISYSQTSLENLIVDSDYCIL